jgi:hypothetical protein
MTSNDRSPSAGVLLAVIAAFVIVGFPLVYVIWETINQVLTGNLGAVRPALFFPALVVFAVLLVVLARVLRRWSADT